MTYAVLALIVAAFLAVAAVIAAALIDPGEPRYRLDNELGQDRWDRRRADRW